MALSELERKVHLVKPFRVPAYWTRFGAFDWGYQHPWSFGEYAVTEDGDVFKLQTIHGRHHLPAEIAERITSKLDPTKLRYISAGRDCFAEMRARGENTPTIAEQMNKKGLTLSEANVARINGLNNLRAYLSWRNTGPDGTVGDPGLRFFDEPGNRACFEQLETMVTDPDDAEDVLKVDADEFGEGGDDFYDETRYGMASRPRRAPNPMTEQVVKPFAATTLRHESEMQRRPKEKIPARPRVPSHDEFGDAY